MSKKADLESDRSKELDQFYTDPVYAISFLSKIREFTDLDSFDHFLEPSAGTGSFFNQLDPNKRIGIDLDPKYTGIIKADFLQWSAPPNKRIVTVGNPPFGKNASLAVKFFNRAAEFSNVIAFILPRTFRKDSIINRLDRNFHLVYDETVPDNSFIHEGKPYNVWCCAQIWVRRYHQRDTIKIPRMDDFSVWFDIVPPDDADFSIQRVGGRAGTIRTTDFSGYSPLSHYFIKAKDHRVLDAFMMIDFENVKNNTAGNPSISPGELLSLWFEQAKKIGICE